ncbi:RNA polymerase sigma factor [Longispora urticae]
MSTDPTTLGNDPDGVTNALTSAYQHNYSDLLRYAARRVGPHDGADAVQRMVEIAVQKITPRVVERGLRPWLFRILDYELRNMSREEEAWRRSMDADIEVDDRGLHLERVDDALDALRLNSRLAAALGALSPRLRAVVQLLVFAELSHADTAAALGIREGTVGSRFDRARKKLREFLGDNLDQAQDRKDTP